MPLAYKSFGPRRTAARSTGRRRLAIILLFACAAGGCATPNQVADSPERGLRQAFISARILARTNQPENVKPIAALQKENARKLSELVAGGALGAREVLIARFARAEAAIQAAYRERDPAAPVNREVLRQGLEDMEAFIARPDFDYPEWGITPAQALKIAGGAAVLLDDGAKGYSYYRRCADLGQMACRNIVADAKQYGRYSQGIDLGEAMKYHLMVVGIGTDWGCAGAFSSNSIARMIFYQGATSPDGNAVDWARRARRLARNGADAIGNANLCYQSSMALDEYLYSLARGESRPKVLREALAIKQPKSLEHMALLRYIAGDSAEKKDAAKREFDELMFKMNKYSEQCNVVLNALLYASLTGNKDDAGRYRDFISTHAQDFCADEAPLMKAIK